MSWLASTLPVKQLELLHELRPKGAIGFLVNPPNPNAESEIRDAQTAARALGHKLLVVNAATQREFDIAFATLVQEGADDDRANELVTLAAHYRVPAAYPLREDVAAGGLMSYGASLGEGPADLPVQQATKLELVIDPLRIRPAQTPALR